jgi:two-component system, NarL family, nitrate/nitrite response regulator NarL
MISRNGNNGSSAFLTRGNHTNGRVKTRVLLYAPYALVFESLCAYLSSTGEVVVVNGTSSADELPALAAKTDYDVVLLGLIGEGSPDLDIIPRLYSIDPNVRILILSGSDEISGHQRAVELGASGIVLKQQDGKTLLRAIRQVHEGETWFNQKLLSQILNKNGSNGKSSNDDSSKTKFLTAREREIIQALALGMNNKLLGKTLHISEATVRHHLSSIYGKLEISDRLNLLIFAYQNKLIKVNTDFESSSKK